MDITYYKKFTILEESEVKALYEFIKNTDGDVLELGRYYGGSTKIILSAFKSNRILVSVDKRKRPLKAFKQDDYSLLKNCIFITANSQSVKLNQNFETAFIDVEPNIIYENVKNIWNHIDKYFIFHDYEEIKYFIDPLLDNNILKKMSLINSLMICQKWK